MLIFPGLTWYVSRIGKPFKHLLDKPFIFISPFLTSTYHCVFVLCRIVLYLKHFRTSFQRPPQELFWWSWFLHLDPKSLVLGYRWRLYWIPENICVESTWNLFLTLIWIVQECKFQRNPTGFTPTGIHQIYGLDRLDHLFFLPRVQIYAMTIW